MGRGFRFLAFFSLLFLLAICVSGQDLGSSNTLFGGKPAKSTTTAKKSPAKLKTSANVKTPTRSAKTPSKPAKPVHQSTKPVKQNFRRVAVQPTKVDITPVIISIKPSVVNSPSNAAANELFEKLIVDGNAARDDRNYSAAEAAYKRAKSVKPKDSRAVYGLGNLYSDQQRWQDAENSYRVALELEPASAIIDVALSYVLSQPLMVPNLSDRYEEAEKLARRAIELAPSNALAFDQLGVSMEMRGLIYEETENAYRNAIRLAPSFAPAYAHLGRLLRRRGMIKDSAAAYESAVKRSKDVPTMVLVAEVMQSEQRYAESEPLLRWAVENDPRNPAGLLLLGKALTTLGKFTDAEMFLRRSLVVSPNGFMPNVLLGSLYSRQGKYELAENALLQALRFVSSNEKRNLSLQFEMVGDGYLKAGNSKSAQRAYKQASALNPENESLTGKLAKSRHT